MVTEYMYTLSHTDTAQSLFYGFSWAKLVLLGISAQASGQ